MERIYTLKALQGRSKIELERLKENVQTHPDLTLQEKDKNIDVLNIALNGGVRYANQDALDLIEAVKP